ncbi:MAG: hypothetical protein GY757_61070, partial [bacterium]|nr:hypothetical protein [bacterium]
MKKKIRMVLLVLVALVLLFVIYNQMDETLNTSVYTMDDVPVASFEKNNGFYILCGLPEKPEVDITSDAFIKKIRDMFETWKGYKNDVETTELRAFKKKFHRYKKKYLKLGLSLNGLKDVCEEVKSKRAHFVSLDPDLKVLHDRMRMMIDSEVFEDFVPVHAEAPLPNMLAWLYAAKIYTGANIHMALEGDWEQGVSNLLGLLDFSKKAVKSSRFLIVNLISKAILEIPLNAINSIMNRKECPKEVFAMVVNRMPTLEYESYGSGKSYICELLGFENYFLKDPQFSNSLSITERVLTALFLQENRTLNFVNRYYAQIIKLERTPPYKWKLDTIKKESAKDGSFWWLQNSAGKSILHTYGISEEPGKNHYSFIYKTYRRKAIYDMVKIAAQLHLNFSADKPTTEILKNL